MTSGQPAHLRHLPRAWRLLRREWRLVASGLAADLWASLVMVGLSGQVADLMSAHLEPALSGALATILLVSLLVFVRYWQAMSQNRLEHALLRRVQTRALDALLDAKLDSPEGRLPEGEMVQRLTRDSERAVSAAAQLPRALISMPVTAAVLAAFLISRGGAELAWLALAFVPVSAVFSFLLGRRLADAARERSESEAILSSVLAETGRGAELLRAVEGGGRYIELLAGRSRDLELRSAKFASHGVLATGVSEGLKIAVFLAAVWAVGSHPETAAIQAGLLPAAYFLIGAVTSLIGAGINVQSGLSCLDRLPVPEKTSAETAVFPGRIELALNGLTYRYPDGRLLLKDLAATVPAGGWLAVTGPSGSGKTTLIRALLGFLTIPDGSVRLNRINLNHIPAAQRRLLFSLLTQEPLVLGLTVRENFLIANPDASEALIRDAIHQVGLDDRVNETGLDRLLDPKSLSGGERERLALARLLVSKAPVAVLDEPGVFLDAANEQRVISLLESLRGRKTVVTVTHNARILRKADFVLELNGDGSWRFTRNDPAATNVTPLRPA